MPDLPAAGRFAPFFAQAKKVNGILGKQKKGWDVASSQKEHRVLNCLSLSSSWEKSLMN
jgi:hypothetical protein